MTILLTIYAIALAALNGIRIMDSTYWYDEMFSIKLIRMPIPELLEATANDVHPPLYYLILKGICHFAGESGPVLHAASLLPYLLVLITALAGMNVTSVLLLGILITGVIGFATGSCGFLEWIQGIGGGMADMFSISIAAALISGTVGLAREYGGIEWFVTKIRAKIRNRRSAEYGIGLLSGVLSAALVNNTLAIIVSCPIANELGEEYHIAPKRLASLVDIFACGFMMLIPHDGGIMMLTALSGDSPFTVLKYSFYPVALLIATVVTIQLGLLRTSEEKEFEKAKRAAQKA